MFAGVSGGKLVGLTPVAQVRSRKTKATYVTFAF
ncbi:unannotated protein [freshwater metagenome]|uniref:Unannotated protein n=1 Tax=freshwater metagenome TaxID=449393 RepID=A0A6J7S5W3_9ZZZZ